MQLTGHNASLLCVCIALFAGLGCDRTSPLADVTGKFLDDHNCFEKPGDAWGNYTQELAVEAMIFHVIRNADSSCLPCLDRFFSNRNYSFGQQIPYEKLPFADSYFYWFLLKRDSRFIEPYIAEARRMMQSVPRSGEGAICLAHSSGNNLLIDYLQAYAARMARAGWLSGEEIFYRECVEQFELYSELLRHEPSGLYSQGRGWLQNRNENSPSCWSRGQGWMMRGMIQSLEFIPEGSEYHTRLCRLFEELAEALLRVQSGTGMWHTLPCYPLEKSHPEVSGTALISYALVKGFRDGHLSDEKYLIAGSRGISALMKYILPDGTITCVSPGPGPLRSVEAYFERGETANEHGPGSVMFALAMQEPAEILKNCGCECNPTAGK